MKLRAYRPLALALVCLPLTGCASIVSGRYADVAIDSYPSNAHVLIRDDAGRTVASLNTPGVVSLKRNRKWFLPARYTAVIDAPGYQAAQIGVRSTINPWILGNIVIGGIPGLVVDNATGAAWRPKQPEIHCELLPLGGAGAAELYSANNSSTDSSSLQPPNPTEYVAERTDPPARDAEANQQSARSAAPR